MIDIHTHILPGMDDGAEDLSETVQMARMALDDGIIAVVATPHVATGLHEHSRENILRAVERVNDVLAAEGISLKVYPGAEYLLEPELPNRLRAGELMTLNDGGRYLLVELPFSSVPAFLEQTLFELMLCGVKPIIAHPERNEEMQRNPRQLLRLVERGVLVQVTAGSLAGLFGKKAKEAGRYFLQNGCVHFLASDAHSPGERAPLLKGLINKVNGDVDGECLELLTVTNPTYLIQGKPVKQPEVSERQFFQRKGFLLNLIDKLIKNKKQLNRGKN